MPDADDDALPDIAVSAPFADACRTNCGHVIVYSGGTGAIIEIFARGEAGLYFGRSIAGGIDRDGDRRPEVIIGVDLHDGPAGANLGRVIGTKFPIDDSPSSMRFCLFVNAGAQGRRASWRNPAYTASERRWFSARQSAGR